MGGSAFPTLVVPRLTHEQHSQLRQHYVRILETFFEDIKPPRSAPEKHDHGDVDIYVCRPKQAIDLDAIQSAFSATARVSNGPTNSFAVPLRSLEQHAQIDVHICKAGYLDWELFMGSYGDLAQIIGVLNRGLGITLNDKGINVRVKELQTTNRALAMMVLTKDPREAMQFLGLDPDKWAAGFASESEIFEWCAAGRYYSAPTKDLENRDDRARLVKRPMFSRFILQWVPDHTDVWKGVEITRERVLEDAIASFSIQGQYDGRINHWKKEQRQRSIAEAVQQHTPAGKVGARQIARGIKRWVTWRDGTLIIEPEDQPRDLQAAPESPDWFALITDADMPTFVQWLQTNHGTIRDMEGRFGDSRGNQNAL